MAAAAAWLQPPIGRNASTAALQAACPSRKYQNCFIQEIAARYPVTQYQLPPMPMHCSSGPGAAALADPACAFPPAERVLQHRSGPKLELCSGPTALARQRPELRVAGLDGEAPLRCSSAASAVDSRVMLVLGVPSSPNAKGRERRAAIRDGWMRDERVGRSVVGCFLLSSQTPEPMLGELKAEAARHGDLLFLDAPETPWLITQPTKYSGYKKKGRGMPTFKQFAFFQHAAASWPSVPFVGKVDDDTAPNLRLLYPFLSSLRCIGRTPPPPAAPPGTTPPLFAPRAEPATPDPAADEPFALIGAINWAAYVPRAHEFGVRGDRCGFGWALRAALTNFGTSFGTAGQKGYVEACDLRGGVPPFPYATGAGYIFSSALLRWVATSAEVSGWVAEAAGPDREQLQWQKFEDTSTAYWLSYAPRLVRYVDVGPLIHDIDCMADGERKRRGGGTYRPPTNASVLVHNLKGPHAFGFAWRHMGSVTLPYSHEDCVRTVWNRGQVLSREQVARIMRDEARLGAAGKRGGGRGRGRGGGRGKGRGKGRGGAAELTGALWAAALASDEPQLMRQRNVDLAATLRARGQPTLGGKAVLTERLLKFARLCAASDSSAKAPPGCDRETV